MTSTIFNSLDADLVLRSCEPNALECRVHKCILAIASPFFQQMLELPQPQQELKQGKPYVPVVDVSEDAETLEALLRFVYPTSKPVISDLDRLTPVLEAAFKYEFNAVVDHLRTLLIAPCFLKSDPVRVYAIACRFDLEDAASVAARHTLSVNVLDAPPTEDLKCISAYQYCQLRTLHKTRAAAAQELLLIPDNVKCMMCNGTHYGAFSPPRWWKDFEERARKELSVRPATDVIFSMPFLTQAAHAGCERCAGSILDAHWFLADLKKRIDELPSAI
jgi:hypothetical protein